MLDPKFIRENPELIRQAAAAKRVACDVDRLIAVDARRREIQVELDGLRGKVREGGELMGLLRNPKSPAYKQALSAGKTEADIKAFADQTQAELTGLKPRIKALEDEEQTVAAEFDRLMLTVPQPADPDVPPGRDDTENVEIKRVGEVRRFDFEPKDHVTLGTELGILDIERGVKLAGSRNYILKGDGSLLHQAVLRLAQDMMIARGFVPMTVPVLVREDVMVGTGYFPAGRDQAYLCERDAMSLVGTAEVPVTAYHSDEILAEGDLPKKYVAQSTCFRREAGAAGKDTHGLYRIHLFEKVEQVVICRNDVEESKRWHHEILKNAEDVLAALKLPYRVVNVCTGDLGQGQAQKFDVETWMPSRGGYGETHSASRFYEFQARRLKLRYRDGAKKNHYCHTLNNTVIASPRILIPILELYQNADGTVTIPEALRPYLGDRVRIERSG
ncbi:MAG: serine--tRNA ligase [Phycisphaerae bacterium]|nr:MAG: serine--tRNA ligase [Planctomycetota bacterium]KAB2945305.1 MAG: serine--tRNA ligase [Phycisphaerae bacterium]MBE7458882.1 serine--tRNA ligase [Planctomycetia bacterium]MCK6466138.1 serine--tRNA ligase [Phycisphaerae bacterium]MCL4720081.1 serine--tRNA ligase [Phycisphaerae bacterium]